MRAVVLSLKDFEKIPLHSTKKSVGATKGEIDGMLYDLEVKRKAWVTEGDQETLYFTIRAKILGQDKEIGFKLAPVMIYVEKLVYTDSGRVKKKVPQPAASWRLFKDLMEKKLISIKYGITTPEAEFMSDIVYQLKDERGENIEATLGEMLSQGTIPLKLEYKPEGQSDSRRLVDAQFKVVDHE